jgi:hypothetical protein
VHFSLSAVKVISNQRGCDGAYIREVRSAWLEEFLKRGHLREAAIGSNTEMELREISC